MEEVDAEISEMKLFLNGRARFVAEGYLAQVILDHQLLISSLPKVYFRIVCRIYATSSLLPGIAHRALSSIAGMSNLMPLPRTVHT